MGRNIVLLDFDGTLAKSAPGMFEAIRYALVKNNLEIPSEKALKEFMGPSLVHSLEKNNVPEDKILSVIKDYQVAYMKPTIPDPENPSQKIPAQFLCELYPHIREVLEHLVKKDDYVLALATAKPENQAKPICEYLDLEKYLQCLCGSVTDTESMHKSIIINAALKKLDYDPDNGDIAVMVGDRWTDAQGANEAGIPMIGVLWGYGTESELRADGVEYFAHKPQDLPVVLEKYFKDRRDGR